MFDENCIIFEPFSKANGLKKNNLKSFFQVLVNTNTDVIRKVTFFDDEINSNEVKTLVTFNKEATLFCKFTFTIRPSCDDLGIEINKIKTLHIDFL